VFVYFFKNIESNLRFGYVSSAGRNNLGVICVHHQGGGQKRKGIKVDFFRRINSFGFVCKIKKNFFFSA